MQTIKRNYILQLCYQVLNMVLPFVTSPYISRVLGAENLGIYSYTFSIANLFVLFINLGIEKYGTRAIAIRKNNKNDLEQTFSELLFLKCIIGVFVTLTYFGAVVLIFDYKIYFVIQGALLISSILDINWFFFGIEQFKITVTRNFIFKITSVILVFLFVKTKEDLVIYCIIMSLGTALSQTAVWSVLRKYIRIKRVSLCQIASHLKPLIILFVAILAQSAYTYIDKIMIGTLSSMTHLGFCENAYKVIAFPMGVITSFGMVMLPRMSILFENDSSLADLYLQKSMYIISILSIGMAAGMFGIGEDFAVLFWGQSFATSGTIIKIIAPMVVFMAMADVLRNQLLIPKARDKDYTIAVIVGAMVNLLSNYLLIPRYESYGAAIGSVISYFFILVYQIIATRKELHYISFFIDMLPYSINATLMVLVLRFVSIAINNHLSWFTLLIKILVGVVVYCALSIIWLIIKKDPLLKMINNKPRK